MQTISQLKEMNIIWPSISIVQGSSWHFATHSMLMKCFHKVCLAYSLVCSLDYGAWLLSCSYDTLKPHVTQTTVFLSEY